MGRPEWSYSPGESQANAIARATQRKKLEKVRASMEAKAVERSRKANAHLN